VLTAADFVNVENIEKTGPDNHKYLIGVLKDQYGVSIAFKKNGEFKGRAGGIGLAPGALGRDGGDEDSSDGGDEDSLESSYNVNPDGHTSGIFGDRGVGVSMGMVQLDFVEDRGR
jgi:hypothetical protein